MKRTVLVVVFVVAGLLLAAPAQAVRVKPESAALLDAAGVDSGCRATISSEPSAGPVDGPYAGSPGWLTVRVDMSCSHHWRAWSLTDSWQPVIDGVRGTRYPGGSSKSWLPDDVEPSTEPLETSGWQDANPCLVRTDGSTRLPGTSALGWLLPLGAHEVIFRNRAKVNEYKSDLHPYQANVETLVSVTCTRGRAAYR